MKTTVYIVLICCSVFALKLTSQIYHAGELTYSWINGYTYKIKLTNFTSIGSANLYDPCQDTLCSGLAVFRSNGSTGPCGFGGSGTPINANIKMNVYEGNRNYPGPGNYIECVNHINRNPNIVNIPNSLNQSMYLESFLAIPTFGTGKNSSPVFTNLPLAIGCLNSGCFIYNPGAYDTDGDSLSYEIMSCRNASGVIPGYTFPNFGTAGTFTINPVSGTLYWCDPQTSGDFNVVIKISEWRQTSIGNRVLIGYVLRDTQFTLSACTPVKQLATLDNQITVFPNPVKENLTIAYNQNTTNLFTVELMDVMGKQVKALTTHTILSSEKNTIINLADVDAGVYFIKVTDSSNYFTIKKIIKQ